MSEPTTSEIVIRGRAAAWLLLPLIDDFSVEHTADGDTRLVGVVRDAAHLHGVVSHLSSVGVELVSIVPVNVPGHNSTTQTSTLPTSTEWSTHR